MSQVSVTSEAWPFPAVRVVAPSRVESSPSFENFATTLSPVLGLCQTKTNLTEETEDTE